MGRLSGLGLAVDLPPGWDGRIYAHGDAGDGASRAALHAGTFPLPAERGDYGSGAVEAMGPGDVLIVLLEFDRASTGKSLFAAAGVPVPAPEDFSQSRLQRPVAGQAGAQWFFSQAGRAFCLYVVLGSLADRTHLAGVAAGVVGTLRVEG